MYTAVLWLVSADRSNSEEAYIAFIAARVGHQTKPHLGHNTHVRLREDTAMEMSAKIQEKNMNTHSAVGPKP